MTQSTNPDKALETRLILAIANCAMPEPDEGAGIAQWDRGFNSGLRVAIQAVRGVLEVVAFEQALAQPLELMDRAARVADFAEHAYTSHPSIDADWGRS